MCCAQLSRRPFLNKRLSITNKSVKLCLSHLIVFSPKMNAENVEAWADSVLEILLFHYDRNEFQPTDKTTPSFTYDSYPVGFYQTVKSF